MLKRIEVDFNTLTSEPVGLVKLAPSTLKGDALLAGERVILWEPGLEVEGVILYDTATQSWLARPDETTWRDVPLESDRLSSDAKQGHA
jgi:hypothetical protein